MNYVTVIDQFCTEKEKGSGEKGSGEKGGKEEK